MSFSFQGRLDDPFKAKNKISADVQYDRIAVNGYQSSTSRVKLHDSSNYISDNGIIIEPSLKKFVSPWQFLRLNPLSMTEPLPQKRVLRSVRLETNGSNIAEYLLSLRDLDINAFDGIIETLKVVLPYAQDLRPAVTSEPRS